MLFAAFILALLVPTELFAQRGAAQDRSGRDIPKKNDPIKPGGGGGGGSNRGPGDGVSANGSGGENEVNSENPGAMKPGGPKGSFNGPEGSARPPAEPSPSMTRRGEETWQSWWRRNRFAFWQFPNLHRSKKGQGVELDLVTDEERDDLRRKAFEAIVPHLDHKSSQVREAVLYALGFMGNPASFAGGQGDALVEQVLLHLEDPSRNVVEATILALGQIGSAGAVFPLLHVASGRHPSLPSDLQGLACVALAVSGHRAALNVVQQAAFGGAGDVLSRVDALWAVGLSQDPARIVELLEMAKDPRNSRRLRSASLIALTLLDAPAALPTGVTLLKDDDRRIATAASILVGSLADPDDKRVLKSLHPSRVSESSLRHFMIMALGRTGGASVLETLAKRGRSSDASWLALAAGLSNRVEPQRSLLRYQHRQLEDRRNADDLSATCLGIGLGGRAESQGALQKTLKGARSPITAGYAAMALGMLGDPRSFDAIATRASKDKSPLYRQKAAWALAMIDHRDGSSLLRRWMTRDSHPGTRRAAAVALGLSGAVEPVDFLLAEVRTKTKKPDRLAAAVLALGLLLREENVPTILTATVDTFFTDGSPTSDILENILP